MSGPPVELTVTQANIQKLAKAIKEEANGAQLRKDMTARLKEIMVPAQEEAKAAIMAAPVHQPAAVVKGPAMRPAIAQAIKVSVRYSGKSTGVSLRAAKGKYPRGFVSAPHSWNAANWRHPIFGHGGVTVRVTTGRFRGRFAGSTGNSTWVTQVGAPNFFDDAIRPKQEKLVEAIDLALEQMAERITHHV